jgi:hypothetical protein
MRIHKGLSRVVGLLALFVAAAGIQVAGASTASASNTYGLVNTPASWSTSTDGYQKYASVSCPAGKVVFGGSAYIQGDYGASQSVKINSIVQYGQPGSSYGVWVHAVRDNASFTGSWRVAAYAVCGYAPLGYEIVYKSVSGTTPTNSAGATCPTGKSVYAAGASVDSSYPDRVTLSGFFPYDGTSPMVSTWGHATSGAGTWSVESIAVCANRLTGYVIDYASKSTSDPGDGSVLAGCPSGTVSYGGGGYATSNGEARMYHQYTHSEPSFNWTVTDATPLAGDTNTYYVGAATVCANG